MMIGSDLLRMIGQHAEPTVCGTCGQALTPWTNKNGVELLVADDGWGSICGDAPRGMHVPPADAPRGVLLDDYDDEPDYDDPDDHTAADAYEADYWGRSE